MNRPQTTEAPEATELGITLGQASATETELGELLVIIMDQITDFMEAERSTLYLFDQERQELWSEVAQGDELSEIRIGLDRGIAGYVMRTGEYLNIDDAYADERFDPGFDQRSGFRTRNLLCQPLVNTRGERIGVVQVLNKREGSFNERDAALLTALSKQAAVAVENCRLYQNLKSQRAKELSLAHRLEEQHRELQQAYHRIELRNQEFNDTLRRVRVRRWITGSFITLLVLTLVVYIRYHEEWGVWEPQPRIRPAPSTVTEVVTVERRPITETVSFTGHIEPLSVVNVVSPLDGHVRKRMFEYGGLVEVGEPLLELDTAAQEVLLRNARATWIKARERVRELENWDLSTEVSRARRATTRTKTLLDSTRRQLEESRRLFQLGIIPEVELQAAEEQYRNLELDHQTAEEEYVSVLTRGSAENLRIARLELENARYEVERLEAMIEAASIRAEVPGVVIQRQEQEGETAPRLDRGMPVAEGQLLFSIANMTGLSVSAQVDEVNVSRLRIGQPVRITGDAFPGVELEGFISAIGSQARIGASGEGVPTFPISVSVPQLTAELRERVRLGMSALLEVTTYTRDESLVLPFGTVELIDGEAWVQRIEGKGKPVPVQVEVGVTTVEAVEILDGLEPGDRVLRTLPF